MSVYNDEQLWRKIIVDPSHNGSSFPLFSITTIIIIVGLKIVNYSVDSVNCKAYILESEKRLIGRERETFHLRVIQP
jgi:hypothetical protein